MRLRNYMIHNSMPFAKIELNLYKDCGIFMSKNELLKWDKWNTVKKDLIDYPNEDICIQPMLIEIGSALYSIYFYFLYILAPEVIQSYKNIMKFCEKYKVYDFSFVDFGCEEDLIKENFKLIMFPMSAMLDCISEIEKNPNITIKKASL